MMQNNMEVKTDTK